ncbi:TolC family protein [bacterium]|nr:TolC family protein [bacterium]
MQVEFETVLREGLQNNYDIRLQKLAQEKSSFIVLQMQGYTTPYFSFDLTTGEGVDPTISNDGGNIFEVNFVVPTNLGIDFYTGVHAESSKLLNPDMHFNNFGGWAGVKMPLLRGLGGDSPENAAIRSAKVSLQASDQKLSNEIMGYFRDLQSAYLTLKRDANKYAIEVLALAQARKHQQKIRELIDGGELPEVEQNRTIAHVIDYEQQLNRAKLNTLNSYYALKRLTGVRNQAILLEIPEVVSNIPDPDPKRIKDLIARYSAIDDATIMSTPVYKSISLLTDIAKIQLDKAENQKLDQFDLDFRVSWFEMTTNAHYGDLFGTDYPGTSAVLSLNYTLPVKNVQQEGAYLAQQTEYRSRKLNLEQLLFETKLQIQRILMSLQQSLELYERDRKLVDVRKQSWRDEIVKLKLGSATQIDIILSFDTYTLSTRTLNELKFTIHDLIVKLKYFLGELPADEKQLNSFSLSNYFSTY